MYPAFKGWNEEVATIQNIIQQLRESSLLEVKYEKVLSDRLGQDGQSSGKPHKRLKGNRARRLIMARSGI